MCTLFTYYFFGEKYFCSCACVCGSATCAGVARRQYDACGHDVIRNANLNYRGRPVPVLCWLVSGLGQLLSFLCCLTGKESITTYQLTYKLFLSRKL